MNNKVIAISLSVAVLSLASCSKKLSQFSADYFKTVPTPLETSGNRVPATVNGSLPAKFMLKNAKVTTTPVLVYTGGEAKGEPTVIQGENVRANGQVVSYQNGGQVTIPFNVEYNDDMAKSDLYLEFQVDQNGKMYALPRVKVGNGIVATSTLASAATVTPALGRDNFQKVITEQYSANIHFLINQANIRTSELKSTEFIDLNKELAAAAAAPNKEIKGVSISSFASPEGTYQFNEQLAEKREKSTTSMMEGQMKKDKITEFGELTSQFTPEDWEGFQKLVEKSNIQDKDLILSVLKMYPDPEQREKEIRNLSAVFNELADQILPQLRYSRITASVNVIGKSDEEMLALFNSDPKKLTVDEMLYLATLTNDNMKKMEVYNQACETYPNDWRSFNDLGLTQYVAKDYRGAKANFEHASRLNPQAKEPRMNLGLIAMMDGDMNKAQELIGAAAGVPEAGDALGVYYLSQGDVQKANTAFGTAKTNNAALAQLLNKDYTSARSTLAAITNPDATTYYLTAILGARTGSQNMVITNLRQAIRLDSSLLQRAQRDLEFANYNLGAL